jgi:phospholipid transport system substrate-binding protein
MLRSGIARALLVFLMVAARADEPYAMPDAAAKIRGLYDALLSTMKEGQTLGPGGRYRRLEPVIGQTFDLQYMARAVAGPSWVSASQIQQQGMVDAFARYITATYANRFDSYSGQQLRVLGEQPYADSMIVDSEIVKADGKSVPIKYLMRQAGGDWRVADIYLQGSISELATRRSEFASIVRQQGIAGLAAILEEKAKSLTGGSAEKK